MKNGLTNRQFVVVALVIMLCGIAIFSRDYVLTKRAHAIENISLVFDEGTGPEVVESNTESNSATSSGLDTPEPINNSSNNNNNTNNEVTSSINDDQTANDTSGKVTQNSNKKIKYKGRIKIPKIGLNKGFVQAGSGKKGLKCVDQNVCSYSGSDNYPDLNGTHLILGAHNGSGWNAFFTRIEQLEIGSKAYIEYNGKRYRYVMVESYKDAKGDYAISFRSNGANKQMSLFTCARPNYNRYYYVISFKLEAEETI